jgi:2-iminobutanoate/2-iminopropanoate deaminase
MKQSIVTNATPSAIGSYSQGFREGNPVSGSGQLPIDSKTDEFAGDTIAAQSEMSLKCKSDPV